MTTLTQNQPPILFWELYEHDEIVRGQSCPHVPFWKARQSFDYVYEFKGKSAVYIVATHNGSITRKVALEWCVLHSQGRCAVKVVDLSVCNHTPIK